MNVTRRLRNRTGVGMNRMWRSVVVGMGTVVLVATLAGSARAEEGTLKQQGPRIYGATTTIFLFNQVLDPNDPLSKVVQVPLYEYVTLGSQDVGVDGFSVHLSGFGMVNIVDAVDGNQFDGDVLIGTMAYACPAGRFFTRLGRQLVFDGAGRGVLLDGGYIRLRPGADVDISLYGGWGPRPGFDWDVRRVAYGARVAYDPWDWGRIGVSFGAERTGGEEGYASMGLDYAFRYLKWMDLSGHILLDVLTNSRWIQETRTALSFFPHRHVSLSLDYGLFDPAGRIPLTSIFSVFTDSYYHAAGGEIAYRGNGMLAFRAYGRFYRYDGGVNGYQTGIRPTLTFGRYGNLVGVEISRLKGPDNAYTLLRAYGIWRPTRKAEVTVDFSEYLYDQSFNGFDRSHIVGLSAGYEVFENARIQGDLFMTLNPAFDQRLSGLIKFTYAFNSYVK